MKLVICLLIVFVMVGCQEVILPEKPDNLIAKDKMVEILMEAYTGNAARSVNNRVMRDDVLALDSLIFKKFAVDSLQFAQSNAYYASQINEYIAILTQVEERLVAQKTNMDTLVVREAKKRKDSIEKAREKRKENKDTVATTLQIPPVQN